MLVDKKKIARNSAIVFISIMVFFTLTSRTIQYFMTPKVVAVQPESGYIKETIQLGSVDFYYEDSTEIKIPERLPQPMSITKIHVLPNSEVKKGDELVSFDGSNLDENIRNLEKQIFNKKVELQEYDRSYNERIEALNRETEDYVKRYEKIEKSSLEKALKPINEPQLDQIINEMKTLSQQYTSTEEELEKSRALYESMSMPLSEIKRLEESLNEISDKIDEARRKFEDEKQSLLSQYREKIDELSGELDYIKGSDIFNGRSRISISMELEDMEKDMADMRKIKDSYLTIKAPVDGIVGNIPFKEKDSYGGMDVLMIISPGNSGGKLIAELDEKQAEKLKEGFECEINAGRQPLSGRITGFTKLEGKQYAVIEAEELDKLDTDNKDGISISIEQTGEYYNTILPNSAFFTPDKVYILKERQGFWGKEYYVQVQEVQVGEGNEQKTQIVNGVSRMDMVVTSWDRELRDGARVMMPLE